MKIAVVIAAYDEAESIGQLTTRLIHTLDAIQNVTWTLIYVIAGTDGTVDIARDFARTKPHIQVIYSEKPRGLGNAFRIGFDAVPADADVMVTMDADLNHQPEEIPQLIEALTQQSADIVVGSRKLDQSVVEGVPVWKAALSRFGNKTLIVLLNIRALDMTSGFRVYRAAVVRGLAFRSNNFAFLPEILILAGSQNLKVVEEPIRFVYREFGKSKMSISITALSYSKLLVLALAGRWHSPRSIQRERATVSGSNYPGQKS